MSLLDLLQLTPEGAVMWIHPSWLGARAQCPGECCCFKVGMRISGWHVGGLGPLFPGWPLKGLEALGTLEAQPSRWRPFQIR